MGYIMIQLRWTVVEEETPLQTDVYGYWLGKPAQTAKHKKKVLQYRQQYDATAYAGLGPFPSAFKNMQWSEWVDVPEVMMESE